MVGRWWSGALAGWLLLCISGCNSGNATVEQETSNLKPLAVFYGQYVGQHRGQAPPSEQAFKEFVKSKAASPAATFSIKDVEGLFISSRDKKPYVIRYGGTTGPPGAAGAPVVAYEQEGVKGKRYVATAVGAVQEVDDAQFHTLVPDAK
jgi:hypothetical protein